VVCVVVVGIIVGMVADISATTVVAGVPPTVASSTADVTSTSARVAAPLPLT